MQKNAPSEKGRGGRRFLQLLAAVEHGGGDQPKEQRMRVVRAGVELRMGLRGEEVRMIRQLEHLDDAAVRRHAAQAHTGVRQRGAVVVVDLVAVAVALVDERLAIELKGAGIRVQTAGVRAEAERAADVQNALLVSHQMDDGIGRVGHELDAVRLGQADDVACEFDNGKLHAEAQAEEGDAVLRYPQSYSIDDDHNFMRLLAPLKSAPS